MYFKLLELLVLKILFNGNKYKFASKYFDPILFVNTVLFLGFLIFIGYLLTSLSNIYTIVEKECPGVLVKNKK